MRIVQFVDVGRDRCVGFALGDEFPDHVAEVPFTMTLF